MKNISIFGMLAALIFSTPLMSNNLLKENEFINFLNELPAASQEVICQITQEETLATLALYFHEEIQNLPAKSTTLTEKIFTAIEKKDQKLLAAVKTIIDLALED